MTVTREDLLRAAYASTEDTERLVYADWLEQHGEIARAQVIHLQCELARLGRFDRRRRELAWELEAIFAELGDRWRDELPVLDGIAWLALERGFPVAVGARDVATLRKHADAIIAAAPTVTRVELERSEVDHDAKQDDSIIPWLRSLRVAGAVGANDLLFSFGGELELDPGEFDEIDWVAIERVMPLRGLTIQNNATIGDQLATTLGHAAWAKSLVTLEMPTTRGETTSYYEADPRMTEDGADALASLSALERLVIDRHSLSAPSLEQLLSLPRLRDLRARQTGVGRLSIAKLEGSPLASLDLSQNAIGTAGAQAIAKSPRMAALEQLVLDTCEVHSVGLAAIIGSPMWNTLRSLDLSRNPLGVAGARALAEAPKPEHLHTLALADCDFDDSAANILGKVAWLGSLTELVLSGNPLRRGTLALRNLEPDHLRELSLMSVGMERTEAAALARFWPKLVHLAVGGNAIGDAGIERFATTKEAPALQSLSLFNCGLGDDGLELLARARCPRLRSLVLWGNKITGAGLAILLGSPIMKHVTALDLTHCELDAGSMATLARTPMPPALATIDLRFNGLDEATLLVLAESSTLRTVKSIKLDGNPFTYDPKSRERLAERFGENWYRDP